MRAVVQRVRSASVTVGGATVGACGEGLVVLLGIARGDTDAGATRLAAKIARLRIFGNAEGRFDLSLVDVQGSALVVSQFTLLAETGKGTRPSFTQAADPAEAAPLVERFCTQLRASGVPVETGRFGATMAVELVNEGPVTIVLDG